MFMYDTSICAKLQKRPVQFSVQFQMIGTASLLVRVSHENLLYSKSFLIFLSYLCFFYKKTFKDFIINFKQPAAGQYSVPIYIQIYSPI